MPSQSGSNEENEAAESAERTTSTSPPRSQRSLGSARTSDNDLRGRVGYGGSAEATESTGLLSDSNGRLRNYKSTPNTPRPGVTRHDSGGTPTATRFYRERSNSWSSRIASALNRSFISSEDRMAESKGSLIDDRVWYDQYTSTDWVHDSIADNFRVRDLRSRKDLRGRLIAWFDGAQGWVLAALVGLIMALFAYVIDITETAIYDIKEGYCTSGFHIPRSQCCSSASEDCPLWNTWGDTLNFTGLGRQTVDYIAFVTFCVLFATVGCLLTMTTKTVVTSSASIPTMDEDLSVKPSGLPTDTKTTVQAVGMGFVQTQGDARPIAQSVYYPAAGSGVAEVRVILSGFVLHGYLGLRTLIVKTIGLILAVASGLSLGKEGPLVHIGTCIGNICCRLFSKYNHNDAKRREVLSGGAASGLSVAFGAPIAGTLFSLEDVAYYFPPKTLFRTFFACIAAALSLKFLNPYGTGKIVIFEVRYTSDWKFFEIFVFILVGILGGGIGALFIKASRKWASTFRRIPFIKNNPLLEVMLVAFITGVLCFWNRYTNLPVTQLLFELAGPCKENQDSELCPKNMDDIQRIIRTLGIAFIIKGFLTTITFGIKLPAGIYVPSMVVGGLLGRIVGHAVQYLSMAYSDSPIFATCHARGHSEGCITPGIYALIAAGATMCGVTRLSVTLVVILFELTGSLDHVLPFSMAVLVAKWTADALEPLSIYDLLTELNSYPFLDNKIRPVFTTELGDITPRMRAERIIDVSDTPMVPAASLRGKLSLLHDAGELDGGLPILRFGVLVGLIPAPDLEYALDRLEDEEETLCLMVPRPQAVAADELAEAEEDPTDFTCYVDPAPVTLDIRSPMDLVYQCFVKLGLRFICVLRDGKYAGLIHKKAFVKYVKELNETEYRRM